jgi:hypothetical protein
LAVLEELLKERLGDIAAIPEDVAPQVFSQLGDGAAVIDISGREVAGQQVALLVDDEGEFEPREPAHGVLAPVGEAGKNFMGVNPFRMTDAERRRIDNGDPLTRALAGLAVSAERAEGLGAAL